ncbi:hypothetical protein M1V81_28030, partial [Klebsiella pneumoniae]|nr:hypothetical protein [Klebsiella pneumoniae]
FSGGPRITSRYPAPEAQRAEREYGGRPGADRVQVVAALMAIDAELERLRHAVLEKGADDDR